MLTRRTLFAVGLGAALLAGGVAHQVQGAVQAHPVVDLQPRLSVHTVSLQQAVHLRAVQTDESTRGPDVGPNVQQDVQQGSQSGPDVQTGGPDHEGTTAAAPDGDNLQVQQ